MPKEAIYIPRREVTPYLRENDVRWTRGGKVSIGDEFHGIRVANLPTEENPHTGELDGIFIDPKKIDLDRLDIIENTGLEYLVALVHERLVNAFRLVIEARNAPPVPSPSLEAEFLHDLGLISVSARNKLLTTIGGSIKVLLRRPAKNLEIG